MKGKTKKTKASNIIIFIGLFLLAIVYLFPIFIVFINSFKGKFFIADHPFNIPDHKTFVKLENYTEGISKTDFFQAGKWSFFITVTSVAAIVLFTSMTAWFITRVKNKFNTILYYSFVFSMIVPFQMVMYLMAKFANMIHIDNPYGIVILYLGFGAGQAIFLFSGFIKTVPFELEEAAMIDGCNPISTFFKVVIPVLKPIYVTVAILNTMWVWNDYLLPQITIGTEYRTIPIAVQYLRSGYGSIDMGAMMACLVLAIVPIIVFYLFCQRYIIEGVAAGAVKG
jgi:raffinose/stachyose/melibiose transport system permease protein